VTRLLLAVAVSVVGSIFLLFIMEGLWLESFASFAILLVAAFAYGWVKFGRSSERLP
jgi:hypothetical protein